MSHEIESAAEDAMILTIKALGGKETGDKPVDEHDEWYKPRERHSEDM
jgi:hypothetical protein